MPSDSTISSNSSIVPQGNTPAPSSLLFPPPLAADMDDTDTPLAAQISKPCLLPKRPLMAPFSEAAKSLLSSPLPPELVVDFKGKTFQLSLRYLFFFCFVLFLSAVTSETRRTASGKKKKERNKTNQQNRKRKTQID